VLKFTEKAVDRLAARQRATGEVRHIMGVVRAHGDARGAALPDATLEAEVRATLERCEFLGLASDADRTSLCLLEIIQFPGLRDLPKLRGLLDYADGPAQARMPALFLVAPPILWKGLGERAEAVRRERGWPAS
jgi:hypothetical protein